MRGFDVNRYVLERSPDWSRLEASLTQIESVGLKRLSLAEARRFARLYRRVSSDLVLARSIQLQTERLDYLNGLVARGYAVMHGTAGRSRRGLRRFFLSDFPRHVRREWRLIALAALVLVLGAATGSFCVAHDPYALGALIPEDHQSFTPSERVLREAKSSATLAGDNAAAFSGWLFTHNMEVSLLVFALGLTYGLGTVALLFFNGVPLGALAMQYHLDGQDLFFWAWILPHGITELTVVCIAGGAGFGIARGLWLPGRWSRTWALAREARGATAMLLGALPLLGVAGAVEASISQMHPPALSYAAKLLFALGLASALLAYLANPWQPSLPGAERDAP